jgi:excisionase family DNA binding protein
MSESLTPRQVADRLQLAKVDLVLKLIHRGALTASNIGVGKRPTWRITSEDLQAFLETRQHRPPMKARRRRREPAGQFL